MVKNGKSEALALAIATGRTVKAAAHEIGCSERSAYRYSALPRFRQRVAELRSEITAASVGVLTEGASQAAATLVSLLSEAHEPSIRLQASKAILASLAPVSELGELRSRIDAIEKMQR
jgi:hypothetical protein